MAPIPNSQDTSCSKESIINIFLNDIEYQSCLGNLGLLEGEEVKLQYFCFRKIPGRYSGMRKGLLVFTNDNLIFSQAEHYDPRKPSFAQALRLPLETITGIVSDGSIIQHLRIQTNTSGAEQHEFYNFAATHGKNKKHIREIRAEIEKHLKEVREEKKKLAQETLAKRTLPAIVFCKFCGARNKADKSNCANCGAVLT